MSLSGVYPLRLANCSKGISNGSVPSIAGDNHSRVMNSVHVAA